MLNNIFSLSRVAHQKGFDGPTLGPKLATVTPRSFNEQQLAAAAAAPRMLGGVGSTLATFTGVDQGRDLYASLGNVAARGLTTDAKIGALEAKMEAVERRLDKFDLRFEKSGCCAVNMACAVM